MIPFAPHLALALALAPVALAPVALRAQSSGAADSLAAIAVADSALAAITRGDAITPYPFSHTCSHTKVCVEARRRVVWRRGGGARPSKCAPC